MKRKYLVVCFVMVVRFAHMVVLFHEGRVLRKALQPLYIRPSTGASARDGRGINNLEIKKKLVSAERTSDLKHNFELLL